MQMRIIFIVVSSILIELYSIYFSKPEVQFKGKMHDFIHKHFMFNVCVCVFVLICLHVSRATGANLLSAYTLTIARFAMCYAIEAFCVHPLNATGRQSKIDVVFKIYKINQLEQ